MKINKLMTAVATSLTLFTGVLAVAPTASAVPITFSAIRPVSNVNSFHSVAVDPVTGKVYEHQGYASPVFKVYANTMQFEAGSASSGLGTGRTIFGTYFAVNNGQLFGRTTTDTTAVATFNTSTGAVTETLAGYPGMGGINPTDTFNWGGYSGVNFMQDSTGMYVMGRVSGHTNWQIEKLGTGLASISSTNYNISDKVGYGFIINGILFTGDSYDSNAVTKSINLATGQVSTVNDTLVGLGANLYMSNFSYDYSSDTLYAANYIGGTIFKASNASVQFGAPRVAAVPDPGSLMLLGLGMTGLILARRKQRAN
jgi:autoaggregation protein RapA/B/C